MAREDDYPGAERAGEPLWTFSPVAQAAASWLLVAVVLVPLIQRTSSVYPVLIPA